MAIVRQIIKELHWSEHPAMIELMDQDKQRAIKVRKDYERKIKNKFRVQNFKKAI